MNRENMFRVVSSRRFFAMAAIAVLGMLFAAGGAKAGGGCAVPNATGTAPAIPFVSPQGAASKRTAIHTGPLTSWVCGI